MPILDDILANSPTTPPLHPRLRHWKQRIEGQGETARLEVFRPAITFGQVQSEMYLHFEGKDKDGSPEMESLLWDDELNAGLIRLGIRAIDTSNEIDKFALGLRAAFRKTEREFGDGYFNTVILDLVKESGLSSNPEIAEILKYATAPNADRERKRYAPCRDMIATEMSGRLYELRENLKYDPEEARQILVAALSRFLDERFSVSNRRQLGLL